MNEPITPEILCSTGTVTHRALLNDYTHLIKLIGEIDSDGFEFIIYPVWYEFLDQVVDGLLGTGRRFPVTHSEKDIGASFSDGTAESAAEGFRRFEICCRAAE